MEKTEKKRFKAKKSPAAYIYVAVAAIVTAAFLTAVSNVSNRQAAEGKKQLEDAIRLAAVSCFAFEGFYPPDIDYITENYGVIVDTDRYTVHYMVFADNLMPDISVIDHGGSSVSLSDMTEVD